MRTTFAFACLAALTSGLGVDVADATKAPEDLEVSKIISFIVSRLFTNNNYIEYHLLISKQVRMYVAI